jgi:hypothetical protein
MCVLFGLNMLKKLEKNDIYDIEYDTYGSTYYLATLSSSFDSILKCLKLI